MKLGIITDVHESVEFLQASLRRFEMLSVDQIVVIGDIFETGDRIGETCQMLADADVIGVWGNHDFGLCFETDDETREKYSDGVLDYMGSLLPRLEVEGCHFMHNEPWLDPMSLEDLWYFGGPPNGDFDLTRIFDSVPNRLMFAGHYHRWMLASPTGVTTWVGDETIWLDQGRYFVVVGALFSGNYAILDTETGEFQPFREQA
jgi:hypothetical protein